MNLYLLFYIIAALVSISAGLGVWNKYRNTSGVFFALYGISLGIWLILYYAFFASSTPDSVMLTLSRINYGISGIGMYFLLFFVYFFEKPTTPYTKIQTWSIVGMSILIFGCASSTPWVIAGLSHDPLENTYREVPGALFSLYTGLYIAFLLLFSGVLIATFRKQYGIARMRIFYISIWSLIFLTLMISLQVILPLFGIWVFEREVVVLFALYTLGILVIVKRYTFAPFWYDVGKVITSILAGVIAFLSVQLINSEWLLDYLNGGQFWGGEDSRGITDFVVSIVVFLWTYRIISEHIFKKIFPDTLMLRVNELERKITQIQYHDILDTFFSQEVGLIFGASSAHIFLLEKDEKHDHPLARYFSEKRGGYPFIHDQAFVDEHRESLDAFPGLIASLPHDAYLIFPLYGKNDIFIGFFSLGHKRFGQAYDLFEVEALEHITDFTARQLRYIETYTQLEDISRNLDRKVDEKTLEYNTLISRQRDFISTLSHEVKTPVTSAILQLDNILDDIENDRVGIGVLRDELELLSENLVATGELLSRLFSIEYMDRQDAILYPELIDITRLLKNQYQLQKKVHPECLWHESIEKDLGYIFVDRVQITQVINNILNNAIKFAHRLHPEIFIAAKRTDTTLIIIIEDNGKGIKGIEWNDIFKKYTIGNNSVGLGIGLYLCRRIIDLHQGDIQAKKGEHLSGVRIEITLPCSSIS